LVSSLRRVPSPPAKITAFMQLPRKFAEILFVFPDMKRMHLYGEKLISDLFFSVNNLTVFFDKIMK
ncbi:hypothetical protein VF09_07085, partial [Nostoc linckia z9]